MQLWQYRERVGIQLMYQLNEALDMDERIHARQLLYISFDDITKPLEQLHIAMYCTDFTKRLCMID